MLDDYKLTTDYPIDKVIYRSGIRSSTAGAFGFNDITVAHGNGGEFLPIGQWSFDSSFSTGVYDVSTAPSTSGSQVYNTAVEVTATDITYRFTNNTGSPATIYFRVIGLPVPSTNRDVTATSTYQDLTLDTDNNYMKVMLENSVSVANNTTHSPSITLGLTNLPKILTWVKFTGSGGTTIGQVVWAGRDFVFGDNGLIVWTTGTTVNFRNVYGNTVQLYYKVYAGE